MADDNRTLRRDLDKAIVAIKRLTDQAETRGDQISRLAALASQTERTGADLSPLAAGITSIDVSWPNAFPDTAYGVYVSAIVGAANLGQVFVGVSGKTGTGCTVVVRNTSGGAISAGIDVLAVRT